jgi:N-acyl-D-amino-acid deacylase
LVFAGGDDTVVDPFLAHPKYMMGTDGIFHEQSMIHPRQYGSAARLLGPCVRDRKLFSLEEAVHKMTGAPAQRFGLLHRGTLREGSFGDVVVFDSVTISDRATYKDPHQFSVGVEHVVVNGTAIIRDGKPMEGLQQPLPGRALKFKA